MAYVICDPCRGCVDTACIDVCPCECIAGPIEVDRIRAVPVAQRPQAFASIQLYIDPIDCIDCGACAVECPAQAIYPDSDVPDEWRDQIEANAAYFDR